MKKQKKFKKVDEEKKFEASPKTNAKKKKAKFKPEEYGFKKKPIYKYLEEE